MGFMKITVLLLIAMPLSVISGQTHGTGPIDATPLQKTIVVKRTKKMDIVFTNDSGKLTPGENSLCVQLLSHDPATPIDVKDVTIDFRLLVGKIEERPIRAQLSQAGVRGYCGSIDVGRQYYSPSNYYVSVRYMDAGGKKKSTGLHLSIK
jgi:hypothetical protein